MIDIDKELELIDAAEAVVARWYTPKWKDEPHTAVFIERLRAAIAPARAAIPAPAAPSDHDAALMDLQYVAGFRSGRIAEDAADWAAFSAIDRRAEVAMRTLKESATAAPEGQAALSEAQLDHIARSYFAEPDAQEKVKNAIHDAFKGAVPRQAAVADATAALFDDAFASALLADLMQAKEERFQYCLREVLGSLPTNRDWLNPDVERELRAMLVAPVSQDVLKLKRMDGEA